MCVCVCAFVCVGVGEQNCLNTKENADLVAQTRKSIEGRNPHAFAPKIIREMDGTIATPGPPPLDGAGAKGVRFSLAASLRHKKGCHCKKSHCLKKYCECYQAGVKCTDLCKCVGCKNGKCDHGGDDDQQCDAAVTAAGQVSESKVSSGLVSVMSKQKQTAAQSGKSPGPLHELTPVTPHLGSFGAADSVDPSTALTAAAMRKAGDAGAFVTPLQQPQNRDTVGDANEMMMTQEQENAAELTKENTLLMMDRADDLLIAPMMNLVTPVMRK